MVLDRKIAIVTGASKGLGRAIATALVHKGCIVYGLARNGQVLSQVQRELGELFKPIPLDMTDSKAVQSWVVETFSEDYGPDILINNAGLGFFKSVDKTSLEEWHDAMNINLNALYYITSAITPLMKARSTSCHIINIGSILGRIGRSEGTAYCASKFGVRGFSEALYIELRPYNIKVTCLNPGSIETDFFESSGIFPHDNMLHPEDLANTVVHVLETPDNMLINELIIRPLNPKPPTK